MFTLNLYKIETETDRIVFKISYNKLNWDNEYVTYDIQNTSILILKKQINGAIFRLMETKDGYDARNSAGYSAIVDARDEERERLRDIAEQYLDSNGINLEDVREAYIDRFVSRNAKTDTMAHNYLQGCMYTFLAEVMLVFTKITEDNTRYNAVVNAVGNKGNLALIESAVEQFVEELETDEYEEEMTYALESL